MLTEFLLEISQVPTPKCVKNEIRDFEMITVTCVFSLHTLTVNDVSSFGNK